MQHTTLIALTHPPLRSPPTRRSSDLDPLPAHFAKLPAFRQRLRGRNDSRNHVENGAVALLASADPVLLHGTARRAGAGPGFHAFDCGLHPVDRATRAGARGSPLKIWRL